MYKKLILIASLLLLAINGNAQNLPNNSKFGISVNVSQGIEFYSEGYYNYNYNELPRTAVRANLHYGILLFGIGYEYISLRQQENESAINLRAGVHLNFGRFGTDMFISGEKIFDNEQNLPMLFGGGASATFRLVGPLHIVGEIRSQYPFFQTRYTYNKILSTCLSLGLRLKF